MDKLNNPNLSKRSKEIIISGLATIAIMGVFLGYSQNSSAETNRLHKNITASIFWVGEGATSANGYISNAPSAWVENWAKEFGGVDNPNKRCGYNPCGITPAENVFYAALPANDYNNSGHLKPASTLKRIPWYKGSPPSNHSLLKNHWIEVSHSGKTVYTQWEDVGPFGEDDFNYVFVSRRRR